MSKVVRGLGWLLLVAGAVVLLYVVYLLWFTGLETGRAQSDLAESFSGELPDEELPELDGQQAQGLEPDTDLPEGEPEEPDVSGEAYAALWFERDGERIISDDILYVVEGVSLDRLRAGPGHYPGSDRPGGAGNLAIAGHRTTYGAPFWSLNELTEGDTIHVMDREGREWVYTYREQRVIGPTELWVLEQDPLGSDEPMITLTTCHPRGSAAQRLVAWGELENEPIESTAGDPIEELADA